MLVTRPSLILLSGLHLVRSAKHRSCCSARRPQLVRMRPCSDRSRVRLLDPIYPTPAVEPGKGLPPHCTSPNMEAADLARRQPQRPLAGKVLGQDGEHALHATQNSPVHDDRPLKRLGRCPVLRTPTSFIHHTTIRPFFQVSDSHANKMPMLCRAGMSRKARGSTMRMHAQVIMHMQFCLSSDLPRGPTRSIHLLCLCKSCKQGLRPGATEHVSPCTSCAPPGQSGWAAGSRAGWWRTGTCAAGRQIQ